MSIDYNIITFLNAVKCVCKERKMNLSDLENKAGLTVGYLSRVYAGKSNLKITSVIAIANTLEMYIDDLFFFDFEAHRKAELKLQIAEREAELEALKAELESK
jgi:transcriptional regulator with XRE-family HTH domain